MRETNLKRFWYMDWFGHVLDYDSENSRLFRTPLKAETLPDFFAIVPEPSILPSRAIFRRQSAMISDLPHIEVSDAGAGRVAFKNVSDNSYLTINPREDVVAFRAGEVYDWEKFLPLSEEDLKVFSFLISEDTAEIKDEKGEVMPAFFFGKVAENKGDVGFVGNFEFPIRRNLKAFSALHGLSEGQSARLDLVSDGAQKKSFTVTKKEAPAAEEQEA